MIRDTKLQFFSWRWNQTTYDWRALNAGDVSGMEMETSSCLQLENNQDLHIQRAPFNIFNEDELNNTNTVGTENGITSGFDEN